MESNREKKVQRFSPSPSATNLYSAKRIRELLAEEEDAMYTQEQIAAAAAVVEAEGNDFTYGKPDDRDFVRMILKGAGMPSRDNDDAWLNATANALYDDMGETVQSAEDMAVFVLSRLQS